MRADRLGAGRGGNPITPTLDRIARQGTRYERAYTRGIPTFCSLPALMASRSPFFAGMKQIRIEASDVTLAEHLRAQGYETAAFVSKNPFASRAAGCERGFDEFRDYFDFAPAATRAVELCDDTGVAAQVERANFGSGLPLWLRNLLRPARDLGRDIHELYLSGEYRPYTPARRLVDECLQWTAARNRRRPFFVWLHFMDTHFPYLPSPDALHAVAGQRISRMRQRRVDQVWRTNWHARSSQEFRDALSVKDEIWTLYDACVRTVDDQVGRLFEGLAAQASGRDLRFAITADHGEEFFEHGQMGHLSDRCYEALARVPLIMSGNPGMPPGSTVGDPVSLIDLAPSLCSLCDVPAQPAWQGRPLWDLPPRPRVIIEGADDAQVQPLGDLSGTDFARRHMTAVIQGEWKVVWHARSDTWQAFFLGDDPGERKNLANGDWPEPAATLRDWLRQQVPAQHDVRSRVRERVRELRGEGVFRER